MLKKLFFLSIIILFCINISFLAEASSNLESRLGEELARIKGVRMARVSLSIEEGIVSGATVNIRSEGGYKFTKEQKSVIASFVAYSATGLTRENVSVNISEEPLISFPTNLVSCNFPDVEKKLAEEVSGKLPVQEIYVNFVSSGKNFLGEYSVQPKASILVKLPENYEMNDKNILDLVDTLCKSVKDLSVENILIIDTNGHTIYEMVK